MLLDCLRTLHDIKSAAHWLGPESDETWSALSLVYAELPAGLAELAILENGGTADIHRFLSSEPDVRKQVIDGVLMRGGLTDTYGIFIEVAGG